MTPNRVTVALEKYSKQIPQENIDMFKNHLVEASDECFDVFMQIPIKGKTKTLLFALFLGGIAVDRFYIGDTGKGWGKLILKLVSVFLSSVPVLGLLLSLSSLIWGIADIFITYKIAKSINYENLIGYLKTHKDKVSASVQNLSTSN